MSNNWNKSVLIASICAITLLAACSKNEEQPGQEPSPSAVSNEPAELVFYTVNLNTEEDFNVTIGNGLRKKFPHYTIKFLNGTTGGSIEQMIVNNTHFDLYYSTAGRPEGIAFQQGFAYDMTEMLKKHKVDLNDFDPAFQDALGPAYGGRTFFLPFLQEALIIYYNKDIFDRFGTSYPVNGMTWDDMYALSRRITRLDNGIQYVGYIPSASGLIRANPLSTPLVQAGTLAPTINSDSRWQTFFQKLIVDAFAGMDMNVMKAYTSNFNTFITGTTGMFALADQGLASQAANLAKINYDIVSLPNFKESPGVGAQPLMYNMAISSKAKNKDAAVQALKYIVSAEHQAQLSKEGVGSVLKDPAIRALQATGLPHVQGKNLKALTYNKPAAMSYYGVAAEDMRAIYNKHINRFLTEGQGDFNTIFREAEEEAKKKTEEIKKTIIVDGVLR